MRIFAKTWNSNQNDEVKAKNFGIELLVLNKAKPFSWGSNPLIYFTKNTLGREAISSVLEAILTKLDMEMNNFENQFNKLSFP